MGYTATEVNQQQHLGTWLDGNLGTLAGIGGAQALANDIRGDANTAVNDMKTLADKVATDSTFKGFGVKTGLGQSTINPDGSMNLGVGVDGQQAIGATNAYNLASSAGGLASANAAAGATNPYAQSAYNQITMARNGQLDGAIGGLQDASALAGANSSNPAYGQAQGMMMDASRMAGQNSSNPLQALAQQTQMSALRGLDSQQMGAISGSQQAMNNALQGTAGREQDIYNRMMAMQAPGLDRAQAAQQAREFAQGRGGVSGSQFGGTAEDASMARARAESSNQAAVQAMGQAQSEMMNQASLANQFGQLGQGAAGMTSNIGSSLGSLGLSGAQLGQSAAGLQGQFGQQMGALGSDQARLGQSAAQLQGQFANQQGMLGNQNAQLALARGQAMQQAGIQNANQQLQAGQLQNSISGTQAQMANQQYANMFMPMQQQLNAMQVGQQNAAMAQTGQLTGTGYQAQLGLGGIQAQINADKAASELYGNTLVGLLNAQSGQNAALAGAGGGLFSSFSQIF